MRTFPLCFVVAASVVGCGSPTQPIPLTVGSSAGGSAGAACAENFDCSGSLVCVTEWPAGYCSMRCTRTSECGATGVCVTEGANSFCMANCASPGTQSTCRDGYSCFALSGRSGGFCAPVVDNSGAGGGGGGGGGPVKAPIGAACGTSSSCTSAACYTNGWPGGYCSRTCSANSECGSGAVCLSGIDSCVALCPSPGSRSTCRTGYECVGLKNRTDGFCTPVEQKADTGAACSTGAQCATGNCYGTWPGGYCGKLDCGSNPGCGSGICLTTWAGDATYCVSGCPTPGVQSTCRSGYVCAPFAAPRTDGYCEPASMNSGAGGGGGGGGAGGSGGGSSAPTTISYEVKSITGSWSGSAINIVGPSRTDSLAKNTCSFTPPAVLTNGAGFIGVSDWTKSFAFGGVTACPAGSATSTAAPPCTSQIIAANTQVELLVELSGWADDATVTYKMRYPPGGLPGCNYANVLMDAANPWGIQAITTVGKFRAGAAFPVRFIGSRLLSSGSKTSDVSWDFTMTIQPY